MLDEDGAAAARDQPDRGHHRAQGGRGGPALPGRGQPRAGRLARLRADAEARGAARRARDRRLVRHRPRRRRRRRRTASRSRTPTPRRSRSPSGCGASYPADPRDLRRPRRDRAAGAAELYRGDHRRDDRARRAQRRRAPERLIRELGMRSAMVAPMRVRDRTIGTVTFVGAESGRRFDEHDLALAEDLALRAAAAVDNARLYRTRVGDRRRRSRPRCCRRCCPRSRASSSAPSTAPPARATRSAATSTTSSRPPRATGSRSSATCRARAPRRRP